MNTNVIQSYHQDATPIIKSKTTGKTIQQNQEIIYFFLLKIVKSLLPEQVLFEFKHLFLYYDGASTSTECLQALAEIIFLNNEQEFINTLKRSSYIIINNWGTSRQYKYIVELVKIFSEDRITRKTISPTLSRLRIWIWNFIQSKDYQQLKIFSTKFEYNEKPHWSIRYTCYLLVPQYIDQKNPIEQREAARALSQQLKEQFKFDLAMYTARSQSLMWRDSQLKNPTNLGDEVVRLIKLIILKKGLFNYSNLANIFLKQNENIPYKYFKQSLHKYLVSSLVNTKFIEHLNIKLLEDLESLYEDYDEEIVNNALILRTCNRIIEYLTIAKNGKPSLLFICLMSIGNPLTLVIAMLKIILICRNVRVHLENCIANLIQYYIHYPEEECLWLINFMDVFTIVFTIYAENVEYNLVKIKSNSSAHQFPINTDEYMIFSQLRWNGE